MNVNKMITQNWKYEKKRAILAFVAFVVLFGCNEKPVNVEWLSCPDEHVLGVSHAKYYKDRFIVVGGDSLKRTTVLCITKDNKIKWRIFVERYLEAIRCFNNSLFIAENKIGIITVFKEIDYKNGDVIRKSVIKDEKIVDVEFLDEGRVILLREITDTTSIMEIVMPFNNISKRTILDTLKNCHTLVSNFDTVNNKIHGVAYYINTPNPEQIDVFSFMVFDNNSLLYSKIIPIQEKGEYDVPFYSGKSFYFVENRNLEAKVIRFTISNKDECKQETLLRLPFECSILDVIDDEYILIIDYKRNSIGLINLKD